MFWIGTAVFMSFYLIPAAAEAGAAGGQVMANLAKRKLMVVLPIVAILTILSGARLMQKAAGFAPGYFKTGSGHTYAISAILAVVALIIGITVSRPAHLKAASLSQSSVSDQTSKEMIQAEIRTLHKRATMASNIVTVLVILAAAGMAIARYM